MNDPNDPSESFSRGEEGQLYGIAEPKPSSKDAK